MVTATTSGDPDFLTVLRTAAGALEGGRRRVVLVLLDAFGWRFVQRHAEHPLLRRVARDGTLTRVRSQFPSTTTAHVTTMHTGLAVGEHGLYEWNVWEPSLRQVIAPLLFSWGGTMERDTLAGSGFDPRGLLPDGATFYARRAARGIPSLVSAPARFSPSTYDSVALRGARLSTYGPFADGARALAAAVAAQERCYAYLYYDGIDATGHGHGPSSPEFAARSERTLDALEAAFFGPDAPRLEDTLLLLTADHGQVDVSPERLDALDELWPELPAALETDARGLPALPAGSARDVFLHVRAQRVEEAVAALGDALGERGTVVATAALVADGSFGPAPGPRLLERLGSVCVLPAAGRMAWLAAQPGLEQRVRGHHGGRDPDEMQTFLGTLELGA